MRQVNIAKVPGSLLRCVAVDGFAEKRQLKAEGTAVGGFYVAGRVPPLGLKFRMSEKVARKFIAIARRCDTIWRVKHRKNRQQERRAKGSIPHGRPRQDSGARRFAPDKNRRGRWRQKSAKEHRPVWRQASESESSTQRIACSRQKRESARGRSRARGQPHWQRGPAGRLPPKSCGGFVRGLRQEIEGGRVRVCGR